jgi:hypothetical protein
MELFEVFGLRNLLKLTEFSTVTKSLLFYL